MEAKLTLKLDKMAIDWKALVHTPELAPVKLTA